MALALCYFVPHERMKLLITRFFSLGARSEFLPASVILRARTFAQYLLALLVACHFTLFAPARRAIAALVSTLNRKQDFLAPLRKRERGDYIPFDHKRFLR